MSSKQIVGPYFFEEATINQQNYLNMLKNHFYLIYKRKGFKKTTFQQDGAPAHFSKDIRAWLNENFNDKWIR